jgi:hypothetical protein
MKIGSNQYISCPLVFRIRREYRSLPWEEQTRTATYCDFLSDYHHVEQKTA